MIIFVVRRIQGWATGAGRRVLVVVADVIDKGDQSLASIDLLTALEAEALAAGGRVVVILGNHEAEFLADPATRGRDMSSTKSGPLGRSIGKRSGLATGSETSRLSTVVLLLCACTRAVPAEATAPAEHTVTSNILRSDHAGSPACAPCHAELFAAQLRRKAGIRPVTSGLC